MTIEQLIGHDQSDVSEDHWEKVFGSLHRGVHSGADNECGVVASGPAAMTVEVRTGTFVTGGVFTRVSAQEVLIIGVADAVNPRIDRVVCRHNNATNTVTVYVLAGAPAGAPVPPVLTRAGGIWEISLAQIYVAALVVQIDEEDITDERLDPAVCGVTAGWNNVVNLPRYDGFTRGNDPNSLGKSEGPMTPMWIPLNGTAGIIANTAYFSVMTINEMNVAMLDSHSPNGKGRLLVTTAAGNGSLPCLAFRIQDEDNFFYLGADEFTNAVILGKCTTALGGAGTPTTLFSIDRTLGGGPGVSVGEAYTLLVELMGDIITAQYMVGVAGQAAAEFNGFYIQDTDLVAATGWGFAGYDTGGAGNYPNGEGARYDRLMLNPWGQS